MSGKLFIVATPIGNLGDITYRAIKTIESCDYILAESSERTSKLLNHYNLKKKIITFNKNNEKLNELYKSGALSEEEFNKAKTKLLEN